MFVGQKIVQIDAFTAEPFAGNPAGVCLLGSLRDESWMANVAKEMNLSETAFLWPADKGPAGWPTSRRVSGAGSGAGQGSGGRLAPGEGPGPGGGAGLGPDPVSDVRPGDYYLRWFTPAAEVDLCGHATLASAHFLFEEGHVAPGGEARFHTRSGLLKATRERSSDGPAWITLDFPAEPCRPVDPPVGLFAALGVEAASAVYVGMNRMDYLVEVPGEDTVRALSPDFGTLRALPVRGVIVTSRAAFGAASTVASGAAAGAYDFVSRFFAPAVGVNEDPVTGSAHCCLAPYWAARLGRTSLVGRQVSARGGTVRVSLEGERVHLGGQAVTVIRGELV